MVLGRFLVNASFKMRRYTDEEIVRVAGRKAVGSGVLLLSATRDLDFEFRVARAAHSCVRRLNKMSGVKAVLLPADEAD